MSTATEAALARLGEVVGAAHLLAEPAQLSEYEVDGLRPAAAAGPGSLDELAELVRFAAREKLAVLPVGARTKLRLGAPPRRYDLAIDLTRLNRVLAYDPADLTLSVEADTSRRLAATTATRAGHLDRLDTMRSDKTGTSGSA